MQNLMGLGFVSENHILIEIHAIIIITYFENPVSAIDMDWLFEFQFQPETFIKLFIRILNSESSRKHCKLSVLWLLPFTTQSDL